MNGYLESSFAPGLPWHCAVFDEGGRRATSWRPIVMGHVRWPEKEVISAFAADRAICWDEDQNMIIVKLDMKMTIRPGNTLELTLSGYPELEGT